MGSLAPFGEVEQCEGEPVGGEVGRGASWVHYFALLPGIATCLTTRISYLSYYQE